MPHTFSCVSNRADLGLLLTSEEGGKREDERERERTSVRVELGPSKGLNLKGKLRRENQHVVPLLLLWHSRSSSAAEAARMVLPHHVMVVPHSLRMRGR